MKRFSLSKIFCCCTLGLLLSCSAWAQNPQMARSQALQELEKKGVSEQELQDELKSRGIEIDDLQDLSPDEALRMQDEIAAAVEAIEQRKKSRKQAPSAVDQGSKPLEAMDPVMDAGAKGDTSKLTRDSTEFKSSTSKPVADSTAIWGQHIFDEKNLPVYRQGQQIKPPQSYILGAGDRITVSIWGLSQLNEIYEIQDDGYIAPERMPRIFLKGQSLARAKAALKNYFKRYYRFQDNQFDMVLNESRTVNINVFGEVRSPGGYTLPAINTAFNALVAAGGPNPIGSVRRIKLIRNGKASTLDVYKFMQDPTSQKDVYLEHNDILQIPVAEKVVRIEGAVNRPSQYELLPKEDLNKLISWAGGLKDLAIRKTIQIERYQKDRKIILDVPYEELTAKGGDFLLKSGDRVVVFAVRTKAENHVRVMGEVRTEAYYEHRAGMKLSELVAKIEFTPESNLQFAFIKRKNPNLSYSLLRVDLDRLLKGAAEADLELLPYDELTIYKQAVYADPSFVVVNGAVRNPGVFEVFPKQDIRIKDLVLLAGGLKPDAFEFAFLFRSKNNNQKDAEIIRVGIRDVMEQPSTDQNIYVEPYDSLVVLSKSNFEDDRYVEVSGAVKAPGRYAFGQGMTAFDLISLADGFTYFAASNKIDIFRVIIRNNEPTRTIVKTIETSRDLNRADAAAGFALDPYDIVVVRTQPEFQFQQIVNLDGEVRYPGPYALLSPNERLSDVIKRAGGLTAEAFPEGATLYRSKDSIGYIILDLRDAMQKMDSRYNFILKESDQIFIPKQKDLVRISGATNARDLYPDKLLANNNAISVAYHEGKSARYYINHYAAGVSKSGDHRKVTVEHANGKIERTRRFLFVRNYPNVYKGSVVHVGEKDIKPQKTAKTRKDVDWPKVLADTLAQATAVISLILLIDRL